MPDFSIKNTKESSGGNGKWLDKNWTVDDAEWISEARGTKGWVGNFYRMTMTNDVGDTDHLDSLLNTEDENSKVVIEDGVCLDKDEDDPHVPRKNDETSRLFNSMESEGVPAKILQKIGPEPKGVVGYTFRFKEVSKGYNRKDKEGNETKYPATWLVVDSVVSAPGKGGGKSTATTGAKKTGKQTPVVESDEEEQDQEELAVDPIEQAAIATVQTVLPSPKKFVPTFNAKQNGGGVTTTQMAQAAMGNATPYKDLAEAMGESLADVKAAAPKPEVQKLVRSAEFGLKYHGELWNFDKKTGVYSNIE